MKTLNTSTAGVLPSAISQAWPPFAMSVADVLAHLKEDQFLVISAKNSNRFVQFAGQGSFGLRAEVVGNAFLSPGEQIHEAGLEELRHLGWSAPTGSPEASTPEQDPDGSPNYFMQCPNPFDSAHVADIAVRTLHQVLGVPHPGFLEYEAFDTEGRRLSFAGLGLRKVKKKAKPKSSTNPSELLLPAMRQITGIADLEYDKDGDVPVHYGSVVTFTSLAEDGSHARIRAVVAVDVTPSPALLERINELNELSRYLRLALRETTIIGAAEVPLVPFVQEHLAAVFGEVCRVGDAMSDLLCAEFGGRNLFGTDTTSTIKH